ncbi:MAG: ABC transporter permease [Candidatus Nanopelagicales bacterium]
MSRATSVAPERATHALHDAQQAMQAGAEEDLARKAAQAQRTRRVRVNLARVATFIIIVGGWQWATTVKVLDPFFFGQPTGVVQSLIHWASHGTAYGSLWLQIWVTMHEALLGFVYGVGSGIVAGILLGQVPFLADVLGPYIKVLNAIPRIVLGSIFVVWLGLGTTSKVALASVLVFFVVFFNAFQGVREVDRGLIANARILGASRWQLVRHVVLPSALTWIIASLHVAFGFSVIGAIVGEFLGSQRGLGLVIATAQNNFDPNGVFAAMLIIGAIALTAEGLISVLEHRLLAWRPRSTTNAQPM